MFEATGLRTDDDYEDNAVCHFARSLLAAGEMNYAVEELEHRAEQSPQSVRIKEQLAIAYLCASRQEDAKAAAEGLLKDNPKNVIGNSTFALIHLEKGDRSEAERWLDAISDITFLEPEELHSVAVLQLDLGRFDDAEKTLAILLQLMPYDENVLHKLGYARYLSGDVAGAKACYQKLVRIDPHDTVARYYLNQCKHVESGQKSVSARWIIPYQVPFGEAFRRLNHINRMLALPHEELYKNWREDASFRDMLIWATTLADLRVKKSMLSLIFTFGDQYAERILRDFLLRTDQPDELKRAVFGMLKHLGAKEPFQAYLNGRWISGRVSLLELEGKVPPSYEGVMQLLMQYMLGNCREECA